MTECPTDEFGITQCVNILIGAFAMRGRLIHIDTRPPAQPPTRGGPVKYTCKHGNSYWITPIPQED